MQITIDGLPASIHWRLYCRASEHGRSLNEEIVATLNAGNAEVAADGAARLAAARQIRDLVLKPRGAA